MANRLRVFSSKLSPRDRSIYKAATVFFLCAFIASLWPIYPFFSSIEPLILGIPFSLFYLIVLLVLVFSVLLAIYLRQVGRGELD